MIMKIVKKLNAEFERKKNLNPRYSLRAYAKFLTLDVSVLSRILTNKTKVTSKVLKKIAEPLSLTPEEYQTFEKEILLHNKRRSPDLSNLALHQLHIEEIKIIQDWYHYVILELTCLPDFEPSAEWISNRLSISETEAQLALERLVKLNLLIQEDDGSIVAKPGPITEFQETLVPIAIRLRQKQVLKRAIDAMDLFPFHERDQSAVTIAMDTDLIPEVKEKIKKFRRSLANFIDKKSKTKSRVYEISISLFPWDSQD